MPATMRRRGGQIATLAALLSATALAGQCPFVLHGELCPDVGIACNQNFMCLAGATCVASSIGTNSYDGTCGTTPTITGDTTGVRDGRRELVGCPREVYRAYSDGDTPGGQPTQRRGDDGSTDRGRWHHHPHFSCFNQ